jgi:putative ABC transport system ATP-binding protein
VLLEDRPNSASSLSPYACKPVVRVESLQYAFGREHTRRVVLFDIELELFPGELVILTGPSGSGKTTLLSLIGSLRRMQEGSVEAMGRSLRGLHGSALEDYRAQIGFIFQLHNLFPALTAFQSVQMAMDLRACSATEKRERVADILTELGLGDHLHYKPGHLSGGQRQRVAIARALVHDPCLVLADEPTAALDWGNTERVLELLRRRSRDGAAAILMVSQDSRVFEKADRVVELVDGRIVSDSAVR